MALDGKQSGVLLNMLLALALTVVLFAVAIVWHPAVLVPLAGLADRLAAALRWDALVLLCLVLAIGNLARHRFLTPADIDGSGLTSATDRARIFQAILQNTLEQTVIAIAAHLLWAASMPVLWQPVIPVAAILFVIGRVCFAIGYRGGAPARAFGFALTFYPTAIMAFGASIALLWRAIAG